MQTPYTRPKLGFLYLDHVLRFFDKSNFKGWPDKIESVVYHWRNDKSRFINEVKRKKIDVLIGNVPATAYETFREISRALPNVRFVPSLDTQFANKSKENVTHFCEKHNLPIPKTHIFYEKDEADAFLRRCDYPKIIKKSYGPSNYGGYFVHKVDSYGEACELLAKRKYYPVYVQQFVPMQADIRVMLVGHKPICAFWRRPPEGEWLTNTSQGGSMDYSNVPQQALNIAVEASKAAHAEYWACDIALGIDREYRILECATAFAAFPYIRDWIGQYLMWSFAPNLFKEPNIPLYNWEELGKIKSSLLRTMRHIAFGKYTPSCDAPDDLSRVSESEYPLLPTQLRNDEEWPSETWNYQDNYGPKALLSKRKAPVAQTKTQDVESDVQANIGGASEYELDDEQYAEIGLEDSSPVAQEQSAVKTPALSEIQIRDFFKGVKGVGPKMTNTILDTFGVEATSHIIANDQEKLLVIKNINEKKVALVLEHWNTFVSTLSPEK